MHTPIPDFWQLPASLRTRIEAELNEAEKITWIGRPIPRRFVLENIRIVLLGIPCTAYALFWMAGAPNFDDGFGVFPLFGIPFVLIGFGMLSTPFWMIRKAKKTAYVLTTTRAIIFTGDFSKQTRSFGPDRLTDLRRKQRSDGSGDLIFETEHSFNREGDRHSTDHGFLAISDVKAVENLVRQLVDATSEKEA